jgi:hypothetical protein
VRLNAASSGNGELYFRKLLGLFNVWHVSCYSPFQATTPSAYRIFEPRISFLASIEDDAGRWQFTLLMPTARHLVAVGLRDLLPDLRIVTRKVAPSWLAQRT